MEVMEAMVAEVVAEVLELISAMEAMAGTEEMLVQAVMAEMVVFLHWVVKRRER